MSAVVAQETPQPTAVNTSQVRDRLVIWYHETDHNLLLTLDPHLQVLVLRLSNRFQLHYFCFPKNVPQPPKKEDGDYTRDHKEKELKEYQEKYQNVLRGLSRAALFLPCISPAFVLQFWQASERDPQLRAHLAQPAFPILPLLMHPMAGVTNTTLSKPLTAYAEGHERETACVTIAEIIEATLHQRYQTGDTKIQAPFLMLEALHSTRSKKRSIFSLNFHQK